MRTLKFQKEERRVAIARETLDIYAPIAHRLGVYAIKQELEDLSLRYIDPVGYENLVQKDRGRSARSGEENIRMVIDELSAKLDEQHITTRLTAARSTFTASTAKWCCKTNRSTRFMT